MDRANQTDLGPVYLLPTLNFGTIKNKILYHIKLMVHAWSTKYRRNQKLIAQLGCTLRYERFEPNQSTIGQLLSNTNEMLQCTAVPHSDSDGANFDRLKPSLRAGCSEATFSFVLGWVM